MEEFKKAMQEVAEKVGAEPQEIINETLVGLVVGILGWRAAFRGRTGVAVMCASILIRQEIKCEARRHRHLTKSERTVTVNNHTPGFTVYHGGAGGSSHQGSSGGSGGVL